MTSGVPRIEIIEAAAAEAPVVERLLQLYQYDFSEIEGGVVDDTGTYRYTSLHGYWAEPEHHAFLVRVDGELAGLVLVKPAWPGLAEPGTRLVDEFFVMRKYRRRGVGRDIAQRIFDRLPGKWVLQETPHNVAAQAFWRGVLGKYTGGRFEDVIVEGRPTQRFDSVAH